MGLQPESIEKTIEIDKWHTVTKVTARKAMGLTAMLMAYARRVAE